MSNSKSKSKKSTSQPKSLNLNPHPKITEIDSLQDFRKYTGIADIPEVPLVKQIEILQAEARRRENDVRNNQKKTMSGTGSGSGYRKPSASVQPSRYRNSKSHTTVSPDQNSKGYPNNKESEESEEEHDSDEMDSDTYEEEFVYETDSDMEQPATGPKIKKMKIKRHRKPGYQSSSNSNGNGDEEEGRMMFAILDYTQLLIPLVSAHIIFDILVRIQYAQDISWENVSQQMEILQRAAYAAPVLLILHLVFDQHKEKRWFRIASFGAAVSIACYLVYISEEYGYYLIMKRSPPLGTILMWLFIEMHWAYSAIALIVIVFWMWLHGYTI